MLLTPIAYSTLTRPALIAKLAAELRATAPTLTKTAAVALVREKMARGSPTLAEAVSDEAHRQRGVAFRRIRLAVEERGGPAYLRARLTQRIVDDVELAYYECSYRQAQGKWAGGEHTLTVVISDYPSAMAKMERVWSSNGKWSGHNSSHRIGVARDWRQTVGALGMAVVNGCLILKATPSVGGWEVTYVHQGRGTEILDRCGRVTGEPGAYRLKKH